MDRVMVGFLYFMWVCRRRYQGVRGGAIGCCMIIKDEILRMENVEHNTTIGCDVMNEDGIEHFSIFYVLTR